MFWLVICLTAAFLGLGHVEALQSFCKNATTGFQFNTGPLYPPPTPNLNIPGWSPKNNSQVIVEFCWRLPLDNSYSFSIFFPQPRIFPLCWGSFPWCWWRDDIWIFCKSIPIMSGWKSGRGSDGRFQVSFSNMCFALFPPVLQWMKQSCLCIKMLLLSIWWLRQIWKDLAGILYWSVINIKMLIQGMEVRDV